MPRARFLLLLLTAAALAACSDARRNVAREHLRTHPPAGFAIVSLPDTIPFTAVTDTSAEALVRLRLRRVEPTFETFDGSMLPAGQALEPALAELRGWALGSLPPDHPLRSHLLEEIAAARAPFPVKRIVTPAGAGFEGLASLQLTRSGGPWTVRAATFDVTAPGNPDPGPAVPLTTDARVTARFAATQDVLRRLSAERTRYLEARRERARQDRSRLLEQLRPARTFTGRLPDGRALRLVVTRAPDATGRGVVVLTVADNGETHLRLPGTFVEEPDGHVRWRSTDSVLLSAPALTPAFPGSAPPRLSLAAEGPGMRLDLLGDTIPPQSVPLEPTGTVDLIPDPA